MILALTATVGSFVLRCSMYEHDASTEPVLAGPVPLPSRTVLTGLLPAGLAAGGFMFAAYWFLIPDAPQADRYIPNTTADLGPDIVTPIDSENAAAVRAAIAAFKVPEPQRQQIEHEVLAGRRRIGWVVVTDSMDPDGDVVAIEAAGTVQTVVLTKAWTPIPVLLDDSHRIGVIGVKDGEGGGITVALATHGGPVNLRALQPGEHVEVTAP
jgi:hypothetical protein